jgi:hypothetical protein
MSILLKALITIWISQCSIPRLGFSRSRFVRSDQERQRAGGRRQKGILTSAKKPVTIGNKGLKPRRLYGADFFVGV